MKTMRFHSSTTCALALAVSVIVAPCLLVRPVEAQKQGAPLWYSVVTVNRVKKPDRKPAHPAPKTQKAAPLTLQWHIVKRVDDTNQEETDSTKEFQTGDKLKLGITTNQNGYLYIINQPHGKDGVILFPDLRINKGQNYVVKDKEYSVPSYCQSFDDPKDCWFQMTPPAGTETLIVIFSRDKITTLPNQIAKPYAPVKSDVVERLIASSQQKAEQMTGELKIPGQKAVRYATRVQNTNLKDNEELIATIELTHAE